MKIMTPDIINGGLEFIGSIFIIMSIARLHKDKVVRGIRWFHPAFYMVWGLYNLFYYPHLDQWFSFYGGCFVVFFNTIWVVQLFYYTWSEHDTPKN